MNMKMQVECIIQRIPIYILVDVSGKIDIHDVNIFINEALCNMKKDAYLLEVAYLNLITFSDTTNVEIQNLPIGDFDGFEISPRNCVSMTRQNVCDMLSLLKPIYLSNRIECTKDSKGDKRPIVIWIGNFCNDVSFQNTKECHEYKMLFNVSIGFCSHPNEDSIMNFCCQKHWVIDISKSFRLKARNLNIWDEDYDESENHIQYLKYGYLFQYAHIEELWC